MNAAEVIKEIDALDDADRGKVIEYVLHIKDSKLDESQSKRRGFDWDKFIGSMEDDPEFDKAIEEFNRIDEEDWK